MLLKLDVVSLVYNRANEVLELLDSLKKQTVLPDNVILVDNGSFEVLKLDMSAYPFPIIVHRIEKNIGIAGYNHGFKLSKNKFVVVVDSDVTLEKNAIEEFCKVFTKNDEIIFAGAKILDSTSKQPMPDNPIHGSKEQSRGGFSMVQFNGCCFGANREIFLNLGGFDQRLFIYVNEWDLILRTFREYALDRVLYFPSILAYHKTAPSSTRSELYLALVRRNEFWVRWKYYPLFSAIDYSVRFVFGSIKRICFTRKIANKKTYFKYLLSGLFGLSWVIRERKIVPMPIFNTLMQMRDSSEPPENLARRF